MPGNFAAGQISDQLKVEDRAEESFFPSSLSVNLRYE